MAAVATRVKDAARTKERIVAAARREFARVGFAGATVRTIAAAAEVSPNLITRYFGGKDGLFVAATEVRLGLERLLDGPRDTFGRRLADSIVDRWTGMEGEDPLLVLLRASGERPEAAAALSEFLDVQSFEAVRRQLLRYGLAEADATARALAVDAFVHGISSRYRVLRDDLRDPDSMRAWIGAALHRLVAGD